MESLNDSPIFCNFSFSVIYRFRSFIHQLMTLVLSILPERSSITLSIDLDFSNSNADVSRLNFGSSGNMSHVSSSSDAHL